MSHWIDVALADDIPIGTWQLVQVGDTAIAVFNIDGEFHAIEDLCTHEYVPLTDGGELCGEEIICCRHGASFDIKTGEVRTPPAYEAVTVFPVRIVKGMVQTRDHRLI